MSWLLRIDTQGRPLLTNRAHKMHPQAANKVRHAWRDDTATLARAQHIPACQAIHLEVWPEYPDGRSLPDCDATAPTVKGCLDGLVLAGVIPDDKPPFVTGIDYRPARVVAGALPALCVQIAPAVPDEGTR